MEDDTPPRDSELTRWWEELRVALAFFTRLPLPLPAAPPPDGALAQAGWAFPLVGVLIGLLGAIAYSLATVLGVPPLAAALLALVVTVLATGALHEDGLADAADGFGGGADLEQRLAIMRDHHIGTYGVLALLFSLALRAASLAAIGNGSRVAAALIAAHALARGGLPFVLYRLDPARSDGQGAAAGRPEATIALIAALIGAVLALLTLGFLAGIVAIVLGGIAMAVVAEFARRRIGGYTGDVLGAIEQVGEVVVLLVAAAWAS